jgi:hypothetical protein
VRINPFLDLVAALEREGLTVATTFDPPRRADGVWWADLVIDGWSTTVAWRPSSKFGVYTSEDGYGLKPDETYADASKAALRLLQLKRRLDRADDLPPALTLKEIRQLTAVSQEIVAARLSKKQAEVSRLESREDAKLSTLIDFVSALGGTLELSVRFDDFAGPLALKPSSARFKPRARNAA